MGTRAIIEFNYKTEEKLIPIVSIYKQFDGYPDGLGKDLYDFMSKKELVNGLPISLDREIDYVQLANGADELGAQLIYVLKKKYPSGNVYMNVNTDYEDVDFSYIFNFKRSAGFNSVDELISLEIRLFGKKILFLDKDIFTEFKEFIKEDVWVTYCQDND